MKRRHHQLYLRRLTMTLLFAVMASTAWALGQDDGYYLIGNAQDLKDFAALVNSGSTTINGKLIAPIDLQGSNENQWTPIGAGTWFNGTFDGQGFTISNLYYHQTVASAGLFGHAGGSARIKNVRVVVDIDNTGNGATAAGGGTEAGGILGTGMEGTVIINCSVAGSVISFSNVGGIVGSGTVTIVNSYNEATVKFNSNSGQVGGGIHGFGGAPTLINCYNVGKIINNGAATSHMGNIAVSGTATNCYSLENCCQNGAGAAWSNNANNGIAGTTMTSSAMQATAFTNTLYNNALSLRTTYADIDTWMQDPTTNRPILKQSYKPTEGPWMRMEETSGWTGSDGSSTSSSWNGLNNSQWGGMIIPYVNNTDGLGSQMAGTTIDFSKQAIYTLYRTTQTVPSYTVMVWNWEFQLNAHYYCLAQQTGLYAHTDLSTLKNTALDFTYNNESNAGSDICIGLINHYAGHGGSDVSQGFSHNFWFDNRNGSSEQSQPVYMIQTQIMVASQASVNFGTQWVAFNNLSSSYSYNYYKHITFNANGGSGSMAVQTIENSGTLTANTLTRSGFVFAGWNTHADGSGTSYANQASITATSSDKGPMTLYAQWDFVETGTETDPYLISSVDHWNLLANKVNNGNTFSGKYFRLTNNISVTTMVGNSASNSFSGTFDGDGHTLNITLSNDSDYTAPFCYIQGATFKKLKVTGTITTTMNYAAGIAGLNTNATATFDQCVTDVAINSSSMTATDWGNYDYHGGLLARTNSANVSITDCVCGGSVDGSSSTKSYCAGFVGVAVCCKVSATSCLSTTTYSNYSNVYSVNSLCHAASAERSASVFYYVNGNDGACPGKQVTASQLADGSYATALQAGRPTTIWVQDPITNQPMLKLFANSINTNVTGYGNGDGNWMFIASPVNGSISPSEVDNLLGTQIQANPVLYDYDLFRFNQSADMEWENYCLHTDGFVLENGKGYLYANKNTVTLKFYGPLYTGNTKDVTLAYSDSKGYNLVGNPFTVAATINKNYYKMNSEGTGIVAEEVNTAEPIPPFTGVIVQATSGGQSVTFTKASRQNTSTDNGHLNIVLSHGQTMLDNAIVSFNEGSMLGKYYFGEQSANIYIPQDGKEYAIAYSDKTGEMPLNFVAYENSEYTLTVSTSLNSKFQILNLIDNLTGADIDLLATPSYTFNALTTDYASRFKLVFSDNDNENDNENEDFAFISNGEIIINGEGTLQVIDMLGHQLISRQVSSDFRLPTSDFSVGMYVLQLVNGQNVKTQKIVIR